MMMMMRC